MPHVIVKLWPGKTEDQKSRLTEAISADIIKILGNSEKSISIAFDEVAPEDWTEKVYRPEIEGQGNRLYKKPGY